MTRWASRSAARAGGRSRTGSCTRSARRGTLRSVRSGESCVLVVTPLDHILGTIHCQARGHFATRRVLCGSLHCCLVNFVTLPFKLHEEGSRKIPRLRATRWKSPFHLVVVGMHQLFFTPTVFRILQHFVCARCEKPFLGTRHYEKKGLAYCETHYHQVSLSARWTLCFWNVQHRTLLYSLLDCAFLFLLCGGASLQNTVILLAMADVRVLFQMFGNICFVCNQVITGDGKLGSAN